jgi:hypothetical protein
MKNKAQSQVRNCKGKEKSLKNPNDLGSCESERGRSKNTNAIWTYCWFGGRCKNHGKELSQAPHHSKRVITALKWLHAGLLSTRTLFCSREKIHPSFKCVQNALAHVSVAHSMIL